MASLTPARRKGGTVNAKSERYDHESSTHTPLASSFNVGAGHLSPHPHARLTPTSPLPSMKLNGSIETCCSVALTPRYLVSKSGALLVPKNLASGEPPLIHLMLDPQRRCLEGFHLSDSPSMSPVAIDPSGPRPVRDMRRNVRSVNTVPRSKAPDSGTPFQSRYLRHKVRDSITFFTRRRLCGADLDALT